MFPVKPRKEIVCSAALTGLELVEESPASASQVLSLRCLCCCCWIFVVVVCLLWFGGWIRERFLCETVLAVLELTL